MDAEEIVIRQRLKDDFEHYALKCLIIRTKSSGLIPYQLNRVQKYLHEKVENQLLMTGKVRALVLKGRQQGCSSYISGRFFWKATHYKGKRVFILTHDHEATNNLFEMAQRYYNHCPLLIRPDTKISNAKELLFADLDSGYKVGTAGNKGVGRSATIQYLHGSEVAYWPAAEEHAKGILQAVPNEKGTEIFLESTAHGINNYFHEMWQMAVAKKSEFIPIFLPWYWQEEYQVNVPRDTFNLMNEEQKLIDIYGLTIPQLAWRRQKLSEYGHRNAEKAFKQEYPCCAEEAFQTSGGETFISPSSVLQARKTIVSSSGPLIIGIDPAGSGEDKTAIIRRKGRYAYNLQTFEKLECMEIVGIVHRLIEKEKPFRVCIDSGTFGIGICDRLKELGHGDIIVAVNSAMVALDQEKYFNKRSEMWGLMKLWLQDEPCQIPDEDSLQADLCSYNYDETEHVDSKGRLKLERKIILKKRNMQSPDQADALALTFAVPGSALRDYHLPEKDQKAALIMSQLAKVQRIRQQGRYKVL